jgi:hypothetical protein
LGESRHAWVLVWPSGAIDVQFDFRWALIAALKQAVLPSRRSYDDATKTWTIDHTHAAAARVLRRHCSHVEVDEGGAEEPAESEPPPIRRDGAPYTALHLLPSAPLESAVWLQRRLTVHAILLAIRSHS